MCLQRPTRKLKWLERWYSNEGALAYDETGYLASGM